MKSHQSRTVRIVSMAVAIPLSMTACDRKMVDTPDDTTNLAANVMEQPEPVSPPTLSIMRPSVSDEAKPKPAQPAEPLNEQISFAQGGTALDDARSEEHTSELQSIMRISYALFCLKKKKKTLRKICPRKATYKKQSRKTQHIHVTKLRYSKKK